MENLRRVSSDHATQYPDHATQYRLSRNIALMLIVMIGWYVLLWTVRALRPGVCHRGRPGRSRSFVKSELDSTER